MEHLTTSSLNRFARHHAVALATGVALLVGGCSVKDSDFFTMVAEQHGTIMVSVNGTPSGAAVRVTGNNFDQTRTVGSDMSEFVALDFGSYAVSVTAPEGYTCTPSTALVVVDATTPIQSTTIDCAPLPGSFQLGVSGLVGDVNLALTLDGPTPKSGLLGVAGLHLTGLLPGQYQWNLGALDFHECMPLAGEFNLVPGGNASVEVTCEASDGALEIAVFGTTAPVGYSGPVTGGGNVGPTPVTFGELAAGDYNVTITSPSGFECLPVSIPATVTPGHTTTVQFECTPEAPEEELVEYEVDLAGLQSPGAVATGTYPRPLLSAALVAVATINLRAFGGNTFYGTGPNRLGFGGSSGFELDALVPIAALVFRVQFLRVCALNGTLSAGNFVSIGYYSAALALLATSQILASPGCFDFATPLGTRYIRLSGPAVGFIDINGIRLKGVLAP